MRPTARRFQPRRPRSPRRPRLVAAGLLLLVGGVLAAQAPAPARPGAESQPAQPAARRAPAERGVAPKAPGEVFHLRVKSIIHPVASEFVTEALAEADAAGAAAVVVELDTPGGLMTSMRDIFTAMLGARTPVVVWVAPSGAQAASAGFFILMAADVAAMAPGTNTGAAHPVGGQGEDIPGIMGEKAEQDAAATIRSLAARHGRNAKLAELAVVKSRSFTAQEALAAKLVDVVVPTLPRLLAAIDGRTVVRGETRVRLRTAGAAVRELEMNPFQRVLSALAHPNLALVLLTLGTLGIYFELMHPGAVLPGVVGGICLILAFFALSVLPVDYAGLALILLALLMFIAEIKVTSYGLLTVGGIIALVLGSLMLFDSPEPALRVSIDLIASLAAFAALVVGFLTFMALRVFKRQVRTGAEGLVHEQGTARSPLAPRGKVFVHGEIWEAVAEEPVAAGEPVEVVAVDGLTLKVRRGPAAA
jgi:membrane-bound serine protease (ClpP class)